MVLPIEKLCESAIAPRDAAEAFRKLGELWPADLPPLAEVAASFSDGGAALAHLLSVSPVSTEKLIGDPAALLWLARAEISQSDRGPRRMQADLAALEAELAYETGGKFDPRFRALRRSKAREMLRIALRDVGGVSPVEQTTRELTTIAELCARTVCQRWLAELSRRSGGAPRTEFAVLAMGKFGGEELNYSSDIDVIFFYGEDGQLNPRFTHQEFFARLGEKIVATFSAADPAGALFRIDLRLRPEGASGPLVRSLESMEHYYAAFGETWERMALSKARVVAGSAGASELGYEFSQRLQAFIYPRNVSLEVLEEIRAIKRRIEREIVGADDLRRNVKLGHGGIREIEFITQTLQLLHGAKHAFAQERSTLRALQILQQLSLIPRDDAETLSGAYRFLRTVEHRLQIEREAQTHTLPESGEGMKRLARSLAESGALPAGDEGKRRTLNVERRAEALRDSAGAEAGGATDTSNDEALARFYEELARQTDAVRAIFDEVLGGGERAQPEPSDAADLSFFADAAHARGGLADLGGSGTNARFSPRTKSLFAKLEPLLLGWLAPVADPDTALTSFVRFVERYGTRGLLFETLLVNPRVLEVLVRLFDASRAMTDIVLRRPQLIEEIARGRGLGESPGVAEHLAGLAQNHEALPWPQWARVYRRSELLRIVLRDLLGFATSRDVQRECSALAEACLLFTHRQLGAGAALTIVAMGKLGGCELSYGADLDVIFIGDDSPAAAALIREMSAQTSEGKIFPVDARLRPEGDAGPLACSLQSFGAYFENRAQLWEAQALTKSRPISGPQNAEFLAAAQRAWRRFGARADLFETVAAMHARVVKERSASDDWLEFKTGTGGSMQLEFFTQAHQMRAGIWEPNTLAALAALAKRGVIAPATAAQLTCAYEFLRRMEAVLRRENDSAVSSLPAGDHAQRALALRCGFANREEFLAGYEAARTKIRTLAKL